MISKFTINKLDYLLIFNGCDFLVYTYVKLLKLFLIAFLRFENIKVLYISNSYFSHNLIFILDIQNLTHFALYSNISLRLKF